MKKILEIKQYFDVPKYKLCTHTPLYTVILSYTHTLIPILSNEVYYYFDMPNKNGFNLKYRNRDIIPEPLNYYNMGILQESRSTNNLVKDIIKLISNNIFVILTICTMQYVLSNTHGGAYHGILVHGYDDESKMFTVTDYDFTTKIPYTANITFNELEKAYYMDESVPQNARFSNRLVEVIKMNDTKINSDYDYHKTILYNNMKNTWDITIRGLELLKNYASIYKEYISDIEKYKFHYSYTAPNASQMIYFLASYHNAERYRNSQFSLLDDELNNLSIEICKEYSEINTLITKTFLSEKVNTKTPDILKNSMLKIYNMERIYCEGLYEKIK